MEGHPAVRAALEHLLIHEGYKIWHPGKTLPDMLSGPVLLLIGAEDGNGLYVFETRNATGALADASPGKDLLRHFFSKADGIHAFVPKPFGAADVLRVVRAVGGFDSRKRGFERAAG